MNEEATIAADLPKDPPPHWAFDAPFLRAPEGARTIFLVIFAAACGPLLAGTFLFGWRALMVAVLAVAACAVIERLYYRVTRVPALLGRTHAYLTGLLLALTLPPYVPWYVPVIAAAFAIIVGKAVFGGVGHFLWQPALIGRLAVAVMFPALLSPEALPAHGGPAVLARQKLLVGDVLRSKHVENYRGWQAQAVPPGADALKLQSPSRILAGLTGAEPAFSALACPADSPHAKPAALLALPPINDLIYGAYPGGIGETCAVVILVAGLYLIYRNYVRWQLPVAFIAAAWCALAVAPIRLAGPNATVQTVWIPLLAEGFDVGFTYVNYQLLGSELLLSAMFLATEMTSRPVTAGGQAIFGLGCGLAAVLLRLYVNVPIPCYMAVLGMNTVTPLIDALWRPRVFGTRRLGWLTRR